MVARRVLAVCAMVGVTLMGCAAGSTPRGAAPKIRAGETAVTAPEAAVTTEAAVPPPASSSTSTSTSRPVSQGVELLPPLIVEQPPLSECVGPTWEHGTCVVPANVVPDPHLPYGWPVEVRRYYCMDFEAPIPTMIPPDGWYPFPPTQPIYAWNEEACP